MHGILLAGKYQSLQYAISQRKDPSKHARPVLPRETWKQNWNRCFRDVFSKEFVEDSWVSEKLVDVLELVGEREVIRKVSDEIRGAWDVTRYISQPPVSPASASCNLCFRFILKDGYFSFFLLLFLVLLDFILACHALFSSVTIFFTSCLNSLVN